MRLLRAWRALPLLLLLLELAACNSAPRNGGSTPAAAALAQGPRPDVVVVVVEDLRWDEFGAGGHPYLETPNIDRLVLADPADVGVLQAALQLIVDAADQRSNQGILTQSPADSAGT